MPSVSGEVSQVTCVTVFEVSLTDVASSDEQVLSIARRRDRLGQVCSTGVQPALDRHAVVVGGKAVGRRGTQL